MSVVNSCSTRINQLLIELIGVATELQKAITKTKMEAENES